MSLFLNGEKGYLAEWRKIGGGALVKYLKCVLNIEEEKKEVSNVKD